MNMGWWRWAGGPATRRFEQGTRDAKTDVWMVWLQALSSAFIILADMAFLYGWLFILPHGWIIAIGYTLFVTAPLFGFFIVTLIVWWFCNRFSICKFGLGKVLLRGAASIAFVQAHLLLGDIFGWRWWPEVVRSEFPGRTWPLLAYVALIGVGIAFTVGTLTAFFRWWAKEIPDPVRPEERYEQPSITQQLFGEGSSTGRPQDAPIPFRREAA